MDIFSRLLQQIIINDLSLFFIFMIFAYFFYGFYEYNKADGIENKINVSSKVPPILVSIGMLGTFVGILIALSSFSEGFRGNAPGVRMNSEMRNFIDGMYVAFASSVAGLAASLIFRVTIDYLTRPKKLAQQGDEEKGVEDLLRLLKDINHDQLNKMTEVKNAISNADDDSSLLSQMKFLRTDMSDKFNALQKAFETFQKEMSENNIKALVVAVQKVMDDFNNKINDNLGETFKRLNSSVEQLVKWQDDYKNYLEDAKLRLEHAKEGINKVQEHLKNISSSMETLPEKAESIEVIIERLGTQISDLENRLEAFKDMKEKAINAMPEIENNINNLTEGFKNSIDKVSENITNSTDHLKIVVTESIDGIEKISEVIEQSVKASTDEIEVSLETQKNQMTLMASKISEALKESVKASTDEIEVSLGKQKEIMVGIATNLSAEMQASLETQKNQMTVITQDVAKNISDSTTTMDSTIQKHLQSLETLGDDIKTTTKKSLDELDSHMQDQIVLANNNMQEVQQKAIESMGTSLTSLSQKFVDDYQPLTEQLKNVIKIAKDIRNET